MKYTNIKKLLIKFMGGGLINFPTRFLRWIKIDGDAENSDDGGDGGGGDSDSDVFFVPADIQPKYFTNDGDTEPIEIKNYIPAEETQFFYNKEDIISLGINEEALNSLTQVTVDEAIDDSGESGTKGLSINKEVFTNTIILSYMEKYEDYSSIFTYYANNENEYMVYKISDDIFLILEYFIPS